MRRFTINELSELTNKKFAAEILQDVLNSRTNPNTPLADKLRGAIYELENADQPNTVQEQIHVMSWAEVFGVESDGLVYIETFKGCITPAIVWEGRISRKTIFSLPGGVGTVVRPMNCA